MGILGRYYCWYTSRMYVHFLYRAMRSWSFGPPCAQRCAKLLCSSSTKYLHFSSFKRKILLTGRASPPPQKKTEKATRNFPENANRRSLFGRKSIQLSLSVAAAAAAPIKSYSLLFHSPPLSLHIGGNPIYYSICRKVLSPGQERGEIPLPSRGRMRQLCDFLSGKRGNHGQLGKHGR